MATENQRKAADLLRMLREGGVTNMAEELEAIIGEAWDEGVNVSSWAVDDAGKVMGNPYKELGR